MSLLTERKIRRNDMLLRISESSAIEFDGYVCRSSDMESWLDKKYPLVNKTKITNFVYNEVDQLIGKGIVFVVGADNPCGRCIDKNEYVEKVCRQIICMLSVSMIDNNPLLNPESVLIARYLNSIMNNIFEFSETNNYIQSLTKPEILYV